LHDDWALIEASFAAQYGIRLRSNKDMPFSEFTALLAGLMPETPLGQIVAIRSEKDRKVIKSFSREQKKIHRDWQLRIANKKLEDPVSYEKEMADLSLMLSRMFPSKPNK